MASHPIARHLLRAKDLADARYVEPLTVADLARPRDCRRPTSAVSSGAPSARRPHQYLLTRRLERAAALLRTTDRSVAEICVGGRAVERRVVHDELPPGLRQDAAGLPREPSRRRRLMRHPACIVRAYGRPQNRTFREDAEPL